jgi:hypothetical protein
MSNKVQKIEEFQLSGTENGKIEVAIISEPYGKDTESVVSVGVFLDSSNSEPDWKIHIPKDDIDRAIEALKKAKNEL